MKSKIALISTITIVCAGCTGFAILDKTKDKNPATEIKEDRDEASISDNIPKSSTDENHFSINSNDPRLLKNNEDDYLVSDQVSVKSDDIEVSDYNLEEETAITIYSKNIDNFPNFEDFNEEKVIIKDVKHTHDKNQNSLFKRESNAINLKKICNKIVDFTSYIFSRRTANLIIPRDFEIVRIGK
jgi:hypothetical protein